MQVNDMISIVGTLPELTFRPSYAKNRDYTEKYSDVIRNLADELNFDICEMNNLSEHLIDGVHFTHEGYIEVAKRWSKKILSLE